MLMVLMVLMEQLEHKGQKEILELPVLMEQLELRVHKVKLEQLEHKGKKVTKEIQDPPDQLGREVVDLLHFLDWMMFCLRVTLSM